MGHNGPIREPASVRSRSNKAEGASLMSQPMNPYDSPQVPRQGMSGTAKVLIGAGIGCGLLVLLCCGFFGGSAFLFVKEAKDSLSKDPARIREVTESIVTIEIPASLPPAMTFEVRVPILNTRVMTWAMYGNENQHNMLMLMEFAGQFDEQNMNMQWRQSMRQNGGREMEDIDIDSSETVDHEVNGQPGTFKVMQGKTHGDKRQVWQVMGTFHGKEGQAMLVLHVDETDFTKEQVLELVNSMK
jgi:hypothetical protein